ncbi:MAG: hypothetical protein ACLTK0_00910 [Anaerovoracaceae bacterium]
MGIRAGLERPSCINKDATMNELAGKYAGMDRYECRKAWVADLEAAGYLVKTEEKGHSCWRVLQMPYCNRAYAFRPVVCRHGEAG